MSLSLKQLRPSVQWLGEPELAFAGSLTHIDPKVGIPASGPWSRDQSNHPASVTAGFIGTADCIAKARAWLSRAPAKPPAATLSLSGSPTASRPPAPNS